MKRLHLDSALLILGCLFSAAAPAFADPDPDPVLDSPMYQQPKLPVPQIVTVFPDGTKELWLRALERPDADSKCQAADAIARAHRRGVKGMESTIAPLMAALDRKDQPAVVRLSIAEALITLDARQAAASLLRHDQQSGSDFRTLVEPALARWHFQQVAEVFLARLHEPVKFDRDLVVAIRGLATLKEAKAVEPLQKLIFANDIPLPILSEAAQALGALRTEGLENDAGRLAESAARAVPSVPEPSRVALPASRSALSAHLAAAALLRHHSSPGAIKLLQRLAVDPEPAVAALAVARLVELDPELTRAFLGRLVSSSDSNLRLLAIEVLFRRPSEERIQALAGRLNDRHIEVRRKAREYLHKLSSGSERNPHVIVEATRILGGDDWRGQEQAAILLTQLDHKPAVGRLLELLPSGRPEAAVAAGWGLRRLAVPETLPAVLDYVAHFVARDRRPTLDPFFADKQISQLNQFLGQERYLAADNTLRQFIPKRRGVYRFESRIAAIWALGFIHDGESVPPLSSALQARIQDIQDPNSQENAGVRSMSAVTLGRTKAKDALEVLRGFATAKSPHDVLPTARSVQTACAWAVEQITGERLPPPEPVFLRDPWFLAPDK